MKRVPVLAVSLLCALASFAQQSLPRLIVPTGNTGTVDILEFSADSRYLASCASSGEIILWDVLTAEITHKFYLPGRVTSLQFSNDGTTLFAGDVTGRLTAFSYSGKYTEQPLLRLNQAINDFVLTENGIFVAANDSTLRYLPAKGRQQPVVIDSYEEPFYKIRYSKAAGLLALADKKGNVLLLNEGTFEEEYYGPLAEAAIQDLAFSLNGMFLFLVDSKGVFQQILVENMKVTARETLFPRQAFALEIYGNIAIVGGRDMENGNLKFHNFNPQSTQSLALNFTEDQTHPLYPLGMQAIAVSNESLLALPEPSGRIRIFDLDRQVGISRLIGYSRPIQTVDLVNGSQLVYSFSDAIRDRDLYGRRDESILRFNSDIFTLSRNGHFTAVVTFDGMVTVFERDKEIARFSAGREILRGDIHFTPNGRQLIFRGSENTLKVVDLNGRTVRTIKIKKPSVFIPTYTGLLAIENSQTLVWFDWQRYKKKKVPMGYSRNFDTDAEGRYIGTITREGAHAVLAISETMSGQLLGSMQVPDSITTDRLYLSEEKGVVYTVARSVGRFNMKEDFSIVKWDLINKSIKAVYNGHRDYVNDLCESRNGFLFSASRDGTLRIWESETGKGLGQLIPMGQRDWVLLDENGRFDASATAVPKLKYMLENQPVSLEQMKENFYEPKLLQKLMMLTEEPLFTRVSDAAFSLYPGIVIDSVRASDVAFHLEDQGGGIGKVVIKLNGKEMVSDARNMANYDVNRKAVSLHIGDSKYIKKGAINRLTIEAYNVKGYEIYNRRNLVFLAGEGSGKENVVPRLFVVSIGISDYKGKAIDLNYAAKDANDFTDVMEMAGTTYFGANNTHIYRLTTDTRQESLWPFKQNIKNVMKEVAASASPGDVLVVYFAGHGLDLEGDDEFYFLTGESESPFATSAASMVGHSLSSSELAQLFSDVSAERQVLIVDACHSGNLVNGIFDQNGQLKTESIRALGDIKDRTGLYILASSEGQEVSYESSHLEQGLLTYSLLFGMKGSALKDNEYLDVVDFMRFVRNKVPELASDIGQSQIPVLQIPSDASSFYMGRLTAQQRNEIDLNAAKPILLGSNFQNAVTLRDEDHLSLLLDERFVQWRKDKENAFLFIDQGGVFEGAWSVYGRYTEELGKFTITYKVFRGSEVMGEYTIEGFEPADLVEQISVDVMRLIFPEK